MCTMLLSYDLTQSEQISYNILYEALERIKAFRIQESVWAVPYGETTRELAEYIAPYIHRQDRLHIVKYGELDFYDYNSIDKAEVKEITNGSSVVTPITNWGTKLPK